MPGIVREGLLLPGVLQGQQPVPTVPGGTGVLGDVHGLTWCFS